MQGKGSALLSSVFPSGHYLRKWTETPDAPYLSSERAAINAGVLCASLQQPTAYFGFASTCPLSLFTPSLVVLYPYTRNLSRKTVFGYYGLGIQYFSILLVVTSEVF